jgi:hypothetical protein
VKELIYINLIPLAERKAFSDEVIKLAAHLGVNPNWLMQIMHAESGVNAHSKLKLKSKWPDGTNKIAGGLIGFMPQTAASYGTTVEEMIKLTNVQQFEYVKKHFERYRGKLKSYYDVYAVVFFPIAWGKPDDFIIQSKSLSAARIAEQNPAINANKDGIITVAEFKQYVWRTVEPRFKDVIFTEKDRIDLFSPASSQYVVDETVNVDGIGEVKFSDRKRIEIVRNEITTPSVVSPLDKLYSQDAGSIATASVQAYYPSDESSNILETFSSNLAPSAGSDTNTNMLFTIFNSADFFQKRITTVLTGLIALTAKDKLKILDKIRNNPLHPMKKKSQLISLDSFKTIEEIIKDVLLLKIVDDKLFQISDKKDLIVYIKEMGYPIFEEIDPLASIEKLINQEILDEEVGLTASNTLFDCPVSDIIAADYNIDEINDVSNKQCKIIPDVIDTPFEIPEFDVPELMSLEEAENFISDIENVGGIMLQCAEEKAKIESIIQRYTKLREDFYPLYLFMKERYEFLKKIESKKASPVSMLTPDSLLKILTSLVFKIEMLIDRSILKPRENKEFAGYSNQSGITPDIEKQFYLLINEDDMIFDEMKTLYEIHSSGEVLKDFLVKVKDVKKNLKKISESPTGIYYRDFYNKYNSADRVDFLFTYQEQGYITPKVPNDQLLTEQGQKKIKDVKIDEISSIEFLKNYSSLEDKKVKNRLDELHHDEFFIRLQAAARKEASVVHQVLTSSVVSGLGFIAMKKLKTEIEKEYTVITKFYDEILHRIITLENEVKEKQSCIDKQVADLETKYPSLDETDIPEPGNDPFGSNPPDPRMPGPVKNYYWKQFTKSLQTVSLMPIPDVKFLTNRLFRYYPVGLQIDVPVPPKVSPTLASGIPDMKISIPFPIVWKHLVTLTTPVGQFVLWITYCAPYTFAPYLMYIDENQNCSFLMSAKGKVEVPAKSLKWDEKSALSKSLLDRIPGLKIPMKSLPPVDNSINNKKPDDKKSSLGELRTRIKAAMDKLNFDQVSTPQRVQQNSNIKKYQNKINSTINIERGIIDTEAVKGLLDELKKNLKEKIYKSFDFEPFEIPKTQKKRSGELSPITEFKNAIFKVKALKNTGALIETKTLNVEKILTSNSMKMLDTDFGTKISKKLDTALLKVDKELEKIKEYRKTVIAKERSKTILAHIEEILSKAVEEITPKSLGFVESPANPFTITLPIPAFSDMTLEPMPPIITALMTALKTAIKNLNVPDLQDAFYKELSASINISGRLPSGRNLLAQGMIHANDVILKAVDPSIPGWPDRIVYPTSISMLKQAVKDVKNAIWKIKFRISPGGIPPIKISSDTVKSIASPVIDSSVNFIFAKLIDEFASLNVEPIGNTSIKLRNRLQLVKAIFGNEIWDINEQDLKTTSIEFSREILQEIDSKLESVMKAADVADKTFDSILKKFAPFSKQNSKLEDSPKVDIGSPIAKALFATITAKLATGEIPAPPYIAVLLGCALGVPGWNLFTKIDPFRAIEKLPPYERISLKNVPFVIFLDMIAATSQRYGGVGSNYVVPYFTPDS